MEGCGCQADGVAILEYGGYEPLADLADALADRYRIESEVGAGGMATVYRARDVKHDREVALKVLRPELAAVLGADRFLNEIAIAARLDHPHILTLIDSGSARGFLYYVLPFVRGESLRDRLRRETLLPVDDAISITRDIGSALEYAHRHGIVHRDVKPENILIHEGEAVLADFGIALAVREAGGARLTQSGLSLGTPQYMSPEQAMGDKSIDARTDQYSLAAVLYEMLVGEPPHTGPNLQAIIAKLLTQRPIKIRALRETVPVAIESGVDKALAKLAADRFPTIDGFVRAIGAPAPAPARVGGFDRRAWIRIGAAAGTVAIVAVAAFSLLKSPDRQSNPARASGVDASSAGVETLSSPAVPTDTTAARMLKEFKSPDPLTKADAVRTAVLELRRRVLATGVQPADLAKGDAKLDTADALLRDGRIDDAMKRLLAAGGSWRNLEISRRDARADIEKLITDYSRAVSWQDPKRMAAAFPGLAQPQQGAWDLFFKESRAVTAQLAVVDLQLDGDTAYADLKGTYTFVMKQDGRTDRVPVSFHASFKHVGDAWRISSFR